MLHKRNILMYPPRLETSSWEEELNSKMLSEFIDQMFIQSQTSFCNQKKECVDLRHHKLHFWSLYPSFIYSLWLSYVLTSDLDECRAVAHPWKFEVSGWRVGAGDQGWDQIQQISHRVQELDVKQRQRLWEGQQINSWSANANKHCCCPWSETAIYQKTPKTYRIKATK